MLDVRETGEVRIDELLRLLHRDTRLLRQRLRAHAIEQAKVHALSKRTLIGRYLIERHVQYFRGGGAVDVLPGGKRGAQAGIVGDVRGDAQLHLRVVGGDHHVTLLDDEGPAHFAAQLGADGDVLQIGVLRSDASADGAGLVERGVHTPGLGIDQLGQRVEIRAFDLGQLPLFQNQIDDRMHALHRFEHIGGDGDFAGGGLAFAGGFQSQFAEQRIAQLRR